MLAGAAIGVLCAQFRRLDSPLMRVMDALMAETTQDEWYGYIRNGAGLTVSEFEDADSLFSE